jgi:hypothetical protein
MLLASTSAAVRLQRASGVLRPAIAAGRALWLVGADLAVFTRLDLQAVPARHRARAINERARALAPFSDPAWHASDRDGAVLLWCWDAARVREAIAAQDGPARRWEVLPEQLFFTPADAHCVRELGEAALLERWKDGRLEFSALLPAEPRERALRLRAAGLAPDAEPPRSGAASGARRWDRAEFNWRNALRDPVAGAAVLLAAATLWLLWSLGELAGARLASARMAESIAAREHELQPVLRQRDRAIALSVRNNALAAQLARPDAIEAAAEFEHLAGARYQRLLQWEFNGRGIRAVLEDSSPDNRAYVESITRSPWFPRVAVTPGLRPEQINLEVAFNAPAAAPPVYASAGGGAAP